MDSRLAWDRYWQSDRTASCMDGAGRSNYDLRVGAGWQRFFDTLPDGARVLDLCTGNGAVAVMAAEGASDSGKGIAVTGIDLAMVDPCRFVSHYGAAARSVRFIGGVNCEALDFPDSSFDCVVSQYGVEYSDLDLTVREAVRVLAPGGRLRFGLHALEGTVVADTRKALEDADFLVDGAALCDRAEDCFEAVHQVESTGSGDPALVAAADRAFAAFQDSLAACADHAGRATDAVMLHNATSVLLHSFDNRGQVPLERLLEKVGEVRDEVLAHRLRQRALVDAARSAADIEQLCATLSALGMRNVSWNAQRPGREFVGYVVRAARP